MVGGVQMSLAVAASGLTNADSFPEHSTAMVAGQLIDGGIVSTTTTWLTHELVLFEVSFAAYVTAVSPSG